MATAVVCAYSLVGRKALEALLDGGTDILALFTYVQPEEDRWFEAPGDYAAKHGIPVFAEPTINSEAARRRIGDFEPDFLFSFYFREMICQEILAIPKIGPFNLHGSLLPKYRGRAPINWVLANGEASTGVTLHKMTPKPDDGDIFAQREIPIDWDETALSLTTKCADAGYGLLRETVPLLSSNSIEGIPQKALGKPSYFGGRRPEDSLLPWEMTKQEAFNQIRAVADPWPNAFVMGNNGTVKIAWALPSGSKCKAGRYKRTEAGVLLGFSDGAIKLEALRHGAKRSADPSEMAKWLMEIGLEEDRA